MKNGKLVAIFILSIAVIALASAYASSHPDGLEWVAEKFGFIGAASESPIHSPMPDYSVLKVSSPYWSTFLAGLIGAALTAAIFFAAGMLMKKRTGR